MLHETAWAKINLSLHVTGQRADGYHLLDSLVAFASIGDRLTLDPEGAPGLRLSGPFGALLPRGGDNLVAQAAAGFAPDLPVSVLLEKHLPPASGIGGGSADAAAMLRLLARHQGREAELCHAGTQALARGLGADVPVCLAARPMRMRGIGDALDPIEAFPGAWLVLVNPKCEVATPAVFRALSQKANAPMPAVLPNWRDTVELAQWLALQRNDLEAPAQSIAPVITEVLQLLSLCQGALLARMSGSGATCFALFADATAAEIAAADIAAVRPKWWVQSGALFAGAPPESLA